MFKHKAHCEIVSVILRLLVAAALLFHSLGAHAEEEYLPAEQAFRFSAKMAEPGMLEVRFDIAPGYYMYRERFAFDAQGAALGEPQLPNGVVKYDKNFEKDVETYHDFVVARIPLQDSRAFSLRVTSQGCADKGLCYPPMQSTASVDPAAGMVQTAATGDPEMQTIDQSLQTGRLLTIVPLFILLGLGLAFTPCVLPMVPILSFIIVGEGAQANRQRSFMLSVIYSLGMALVYTALGVAAGLVGEGLAASLQKPAVLISFAMLMVFLALAMFGMYQIQMPAAIQTKLVRLSEKQSAGKTAGVFAMGALSALIVGPCVAAPLAGALIYISQTRDIVIGGSALFAMAAGMSIPLLLVGLSAGTILPRAGAWMEEIKHLFGVVMLGMALWMVSPLLSGTWQMAGWALLAGGYGVHLLRSRGRWISKAFGTLFTLIALIQSIGLATGAADPLNPLAGVRNQPIQHASFKRVRSIAELDAAVAQAKGKVVMLDFYADWCVSCKEMERFTFTDPTVAAQMANMVLLQADVTENNDDDKALLKRFKLFGPPGIIFFDKQGQEIPGGRVIGFQNAERFSASLQRIGVSK